MRQARDSEEAVSVRLRSVVEGVCRPAAGAYPPGRALFADQTPLAWTDVVTTWPEDADLDPVPQPAPVVTVDPPDAEPAEEVVDPSARAAWREPWQHAAVDPHPEADALTSAGAFGGGSTRLALFDPGRRGVKALAAVAAVVVLVAGFLAWRARPQVEPVALPPVAPAASGSVAASDGPAAAVVVSVGGKVGRPGLVRLPAGARVADAIAAAGGARPGTDVDLLNLARKVVDGEQILVGVSAPPIPAGVPAPGGASAGPVNLNTATLADLDTLPGVGPVLAQRILDARTAQGGFRAVSDLRQVEGIGAARYDQLKDLVTV